MKAFGMVEKANCRYSPSVEILNTSPSPLPFPPRLIFSAALCLLALVPTTSAQSAAPTLYRANSAWLPDGEIIQPAYLLVRDGKLASISSSKPMMARNLQVVEIKGVATAGMVDSWANLVPTELLSAQSRPASLQVTDVLPVDVPGVDPHLAMRVRAALRAGVVAGYLGTGGAEMQQGLGTPVTFGASHLPIATGKPALDLAMGSARMNGSRAFKATKQVSELLSSAQTLQDSLDEYSEKLEKYEKDMEEYKKKLEEFGKKKKEAEKSAAEDPKKNGEKKKGEKKKSPPKRPKPPVKPTPSLTQAWLLDVIHGERTLRLHADRAWDINQAVALQKKYGLDMVIVGGHEADLVAEKLAEAEVPVVLPVHRPSSYIQPERSFATRYQTLTEAGVKVALASGSGDGSRALMLIRAGNLVAAGSDMAVVWESLTTIPAGILGLNKGPGSLSPGAPADFLLFDGPHPFDASSSFQTHTAMGGLLK
ncbi:MAG: hypothetical protein QGH51_02015 [Planctomycetota bacterium]|jgi:hypothetical protein|nr:hypothetical protein [Planctomycetota bacterium]